jgi:hypothetical protein
MEWNSTKTVGHMLLNVLYLPLYAMNHLHVPYLILFHIYMYVKHNSRCQTETICFRQMEAVTVFCNHFFFYENKLII